MIRPPNIANKLREKCSTRKSEQSTSTDCLTRWKDLSTSKSDLNKSNSSAKNIALTTNEDVSIAADEMIGGFDENSNSDVGFIILRHVKSPYTNSFWIRCYVSIRKYHPDSRICIIDDNSNIDHVKKEALLNTITVFTSHKRRGELLPYYYMITNNWFDKAVILHDSTFLNRPLDFTIDRYKFLWSFKTEWDRKEHVRRQMKHLDNSTKLLKYYDSNSNIGCFGAMTIIERDFLIQVDKVYNIRKLLDVVNSRSSRMDFERVLGGMLRSVYTPKTFVAFGDIHDWQKWGRKYEALNKVDRNLPIVKYWYGR